MFSLPINHLNAFTFDFRDPAARARLRPDWLQLYDLVLHCSPVYAQHRLHAPELPLDFNCWSVPLSVPSPYRGAIPSLPDHIQANLITPSREPSGDFFLRHPYLRPVLDALEIKAFGSKSGAVRALFESKARRTQRAEFRQAALNSITLTLALIETQIAVQHKLDILLKAGCSIHQVCTSRSWHVTSTLSIFNETPSLRMAVSDPFQAAAPVLSGFLSVPDRLPLWTDAGTVDTWKHPPVALHTLLHTLNQHPDLAQFYYQC